MSNANETLGINVSVHGAAAAAAQLRIVNDQLAGMRMSMKMKQTLQGDFDRIDQLKAKAKEMATGAGLKQHREHVRALTESWVGFADKVGWNLERIGQHAARVGKRMALALGVGAYGYAKIALVGAAQDEQTRTAFTTLLGNAAQAKKLQQDIEDFAVKSPWNPDDMIGLAQSLMIANVPANRLLATMNDVGNAVAAVGGGRDTVNRLGRTLQDIATKGKIDSLDLREFSNARIGVLAAISEKLGMTTEQIKRMMESDGGGTALLKRIGGVEGLANAIGKAHPNAMVDAAATLFGMWSRIRNTFTESLESGVEPIIPQIKRFLQPILDSMPKVSKFIGTTFNGLILGVIGQDGKRIDGLMKALGEWFGRNRTNLLRVWEDMQILMKSVWKIAGAVLMSFQSIVGALTGGGNTGGFVDMLDRFTAAVAWVGDHPEVVDKYIKAVIAIKTAMTAASFAGKGFLMAGQMREAAGILGLLKGAGGAAGAAGAGGGMAAAAPALAIAAAIVAAGVAMRYLYTHSKPFKRLWDSVWSLLQPIAHVAMNILKLIGRIGLWFAKLAGGEVMDQLNFVFTALAVAVEFVHSAFSKLADVVKDVVHWVKEIKFPDMPGWLQSAMGALPGVGAVATGINLARGDTHSPRIPFNVSMLSASAGFHSAINSRVPGSRMISSGYRTTGLGNANSDHLRGAYDVVGGGLGAYGASVRGQGGFAEMHGGGSHLHVVPPMGDTNSPRMTGASSVMQGGSQTNHFYIYPRSEMDLERSVRRIISTLGRDNVERTPARLTIKG